MISRPDGHLPVRWLADLHDGRLPPERAAEAEAHIGAGCVACAVRRDGVRRMVRAISAGAPEAPPAHVDRRVLGAISRARRAVRTPQPAPDVLVGVLVADQRLDLALSFRSSDAAQRRLLWTVGPWELDASLVERAGRTDVLGQVVPADDASDATLTGEVRIRRAARVVARTALGQDGRFTFRGVAPGPCVVEGIVEGRPFALPPLVIG